MKYLFIGGANDGARIDLLTEGRSIVQVIVPPEPQPVLPGFAIPHQMITTEIYRLQRLSGGKRRFEIYVSESLSPDEMLAKLIERYPLPEDR